MTVAELIERIVGAYPGATTEAMKTFKPVFYARFRHREGDKLEAAAIEVLGSFRPKSAQPFPIPADFEAHLPSLKHIAAGASIKRQIEERAARADKLFAEWFSSQGTKIKAARPASVYSACLLEAYDRCRAASEQVQRVILSPADIALCEARALSTDRVRKFGRLPASNAAWQAQCDQVRADWGIA